MWSTGHRGGTRIAGPACQRCEGCLLNDDVTQWGCPRVLPWGLWLRRVDAGVSSQSLSVPGAPALRRGTHVETRPTATLHASPPHTHTRIPVPPRRSLSGAVREDRTCVPSEGFMGAGAPGSTARHRDLSLRCPGTTGCAPPARHAPPVPVCTRPGPPPFSSHPPADRPCPLTWRSTRGFTLGGNRATSRRESERVGERRSRSTETLLTASG